MVRPQAFVPVHGTLDHLRRHADLARELGVPHVCVLENGDIGQVDSAEVADRSSAGAVRRIGRAPVGRVHVFARRRLSPSVLQERAILAANGTAHLTIRLDARGMREGDVALATRGVVDETREADVLTTARSEAGAAIDELLGRASSGAVDSSAVAEAGRAAVRRALGRLLGFKPLTTALVVHVSP